MWLLTKNDPVNNLDENEVKTVLAKAKVLGFDMKKVVRVKHDYSAQSEGESETQNEGEALVSEETQTDRRAAEDSDQLPAIPSATVATVIKGDV